MLQRKRHDSLRKIFPNLQVPRHFDGYHRFSRTHATHHSVKVGSSLREKQIHRATLLSDEKNTRKDLNDPKNLVASIIQKQKRASELASSKPSSTTNEETKSVYETAKIDADVALHQQRINEERRKIAEKLSSRFRSTSSTSSNNAALSTTTSSTGQSKREPRRTHIWRQDRLLCKRYGLPVHTCAVTSAVVPEHNT